MDRKLRTYNADEKAYRAAMKRARIEGETPLSLIIEAFVYAYGNHHLTICEVRDILDWSHEKKKKAK